MSSYEQELWQNGLQYVAGIDEVGRGPLAGPVTAAAVILPPNCLIAGINDSKKIAEKKRLALEEEIKDAAIAWACVSINHRVIDRTNIKEAARLAMAKAVAALDIFPEHLLIDAEKIDLDIPQTAIIKGDAKSISIAAASIIAKNTRDKLMVICDSKWPEYGFAQHKGYPTAAHKAALREHGPSPIHRLTFKY